MIPYDFRQTNRHVSLCYAFFRSYDSVRIQLTLPAYRQKKSSLMDNHQAAVDLQRIRTRSFGRQIIFAITQGAAKFGRTICIASDLKAMPFNGIDVTVDEGDVTILAMQAHIGIIAGGI